ncbi:MAG TPA: lamin tail domain-containing protein [Acidimicrobiia bacterium]|nr:lamin tail domain-containing protein [Acidimicrobiia bacterium]
MTKRTWIILGGVAISVVFVAGVWAGRAGQDTTTASSTTSSVARPTTTTSGVVAPTTTAPTATTIGITTRIGPVATATSNADGPAPLPPGWVSAGVVAVVDGDTIHVRLDDGSVESLRLIGTNAPEAGECFANEATLWLTTLIQGQPVHLEPDTSDRDQFGRLLRYVWTTDGRFVNEITVEQGWAIAREYPPDTARADQLEAAEERAMEVGVGLWAPDACGAVVPDVEITYVEYNAEGDDNFNLNGEWVEITNPDDVAVDLTGWVLKDETASHRYSFPSGFGLQPASRVRVFTGCGEDSATALYWCNTGSAVWNNNGDTAFLLDQSGNIVHTYAYG